MCDFKMDYRDVTQAYVTQEWSWTNQSYLTKIFNMVFNCPAYVLPA